jgi:predicted NUDIX family NTP pyrophosphohydrolase
MRTSAGLLMYRRTEGELQVLLVHPGGPYFANKDAGAWTLPKGEPAAGEDPLAAARREFREETRVEVPPAAAMLPLGQVKQKGGKVVQAWAFEGDCDPAQCVSNTFRLEFPPRSGKFQEFPEVDRASFFSMAEAKTKINPAQAQLLERLEATLQGVKLAME